MYKAKIIDGQGGVHIHESEDIDMLDWAGAQKWADKLAQAWDVIVNDGSEYGDVPIQVVGIWWNQPKQFTGGLS